MRRESGRERGRGRERWREKQSGWEKGERKTDGRTMHNADFLEENPNKKNLWWQIWLTVLHHRHLGHERRENVNAHHHHP